MPGIKWFIVRAYGAVQGFSGIIGILIGLFGLATNSIVAGQAGWIWFAGGILSLGLGYTFLTVRIYKRIE